MDTGHSKCYGVGKFRCTFAFIRKLTEVQRYRRLDRYSRNQALTRSGDVPDQSQGLFVPYTQV